MVRRSGLLVSVVLSTFLIAETTPPKEYGISFSDTADSGSSTLIRPDSFLKDNVTSPPDGNKMKINEDYSWDQTTGKLIFKTTNGGVKNNGGLSATANFLSSTASEDGVLTLKKFLFVNGGTGNNTAKSVNEIEKVEEGTQLPTGMAVLTITSDTAIKNGGGAESNDKGIFKSFTLGGTGSGEGVVLYSGTQLNLKGFTQTTLAGNITINSGALSSKVSDSGNLESGLNVVSEGKYSTLSIKGSVSLQTYNGSDRTKAKNTASLNAMVGGNIEIGGSVSLADKAKANFLAGNKLTLSSSITIAPQEATTIQKDTIGNESIAEDYKKDKTTNLNLVAKSIEMSGRIDVGLNAKTLETKETDGKTTITQAPSDVGASVKIKAFTPLSLEAPSTEEKPKDWVDITKAQFLQSSGSAINIGKNSDVTILTINKPVENDTSIFTKEDPYSIKLANVTIQDQDAGNQKPNLVVQAQNWNHSEIDPTFAKDSIGLVEKNAGKILLQGTFDFGKNAIGLVEAVDGVEMSKDANIKLGYDSILVLKMGNQKDAQTQNTSNAGKIELNGGTLALVGLSSLSNTSEIKIGDSLRFTDAPKAQEGQETQKIPLDSRGLFFLNDGDNTLDNQGSLILDGNGNLSTLQTLDDTQTRRNLIIKNSKGKGNIFANGKGNTLSANGDLQITSQAVSIKTKEIKKEDKVVEVQDGELLIKTANTQEQVNIIFGDQNENAGRDRVDISGGLLRLESYLGGVESYNLRLADLTLDFTKLSFVPQECKDNQCESLIYGGGAFVNKRRLDLNGKVTLLAPNEEGAFINGASISEMGLEPKTSLHSLKDLAEMNIVGDNFVGFRGEAQKNQTGFSLINNGKIVLKSGATLGVGGDFVNNGQVVFKADQFGIGRLDIAGKIVFDLSDYQTGEFYGYSPLIQIDHSNFYGLNLYEGYLLMQSTQAIEYRVGNAVITAVPPIERSPRAEETEDKLNYGAQQALLKQQIEDYLNGRNGYEDNDGKLGVFLNGVALIGENYVGFGITRSEAISQIKIDGSNTGVIDQYLQILGKSEGFVSADRTEQMYRDLQNNGEKTLQLLNNALETQNRLELGILKDMGAYNTSSLIAVANAMDRAMRASVDLMQPVYDDFRKMQATREVSIQNRILKASNPFAAEMKLAELIQKAKRYANNDLANDSALSTQEVKSDAIINPFALENVDTKHAFWASLIASTLRGSGNSEIYGLSAGYEYQPHDSVLVGGYLAYGYSNYKSDHLTNNAHNLDISAYVRLFYGYSELDVSFDYLTSFNEARVSESTLPLLNNDYAFNANSFNFSLRYGYVFDTPLQSLYIKPLASLGIFGVFLPEAQGDSQIPIAVAEQSKGGISASVGAEFRQYVSAYSYLYALPSFDFAFFDKKSGTNVSFAGAYNQLNYAPTKQSQYSFSILAGGEGYVSKNFSLNASAGYKVGLDKQDQNISISAGLKYKF